MIQETIITSISADGAPHITPFGVREEAGQVIIAPYRPSKTLDNIVLTKAAAINFTDDVRVFAGALTNRTDWPLLPTSAAQGFRLADCLAHSELALLHVIEDSVRPQLVMRVVNSFNHRPFQGFNRAQAAVIELAVLVSRLARLPREKVMTEHAYLQIAIDKTAGEREREAWGWLTEKLEAYYQTQDLAGKA